MPRKSSPRTTRPSGIQQSGNGNYFYWKCNVSGKETFADKARFSDILKTYGSEENLFKTYVLGPAKKYLASGFDIETIKAILEANKGVLPALERKAKASHTPKQKRGRKPKQKPFLVKSEDASGEVSSENVEYPWTKNPDYFKSTPAKLSIEELTKDSCAYPNRYLSDLCKGCSIYQQCSFKNKYAESDWKNSKPRNEVKIKKLDSFSE